MIELDMTLLIQVVNFLIAVWVIKRYAYKPIMKAIEDRQKQISDSLDNAEKTRLDVEVLRNEYQQQLNEARKDAGDIVEKARKAADDARNEIMAKSKEDATRILRQAQEEISREKDAALAEIKNQVAELSVLVAEKIIGRTLDAQAHADLVDDSIREVGNMPC